MMASAPFSVQPSVALNATETGRRGGQFLGDRTVTKDEYGRPRLLSSIREKRQS